MAKRFQQLCASSRMMSPLCKHLSFSPAAICAKKVKLSQVGKELGPEDGLICPYFVSVKEKEEKKVEKKSSKSRKKKTDEEKSI